MFQSLVRDLNRKMGGDLTQFIWYLERHIELDGNDQGTASLRMVAELCGDVAALWKESLQAAEDAIRAQLDLWDGILEEIRKNESDAINL